MCFKWYRDRQLRKLCPPNGGERGPTTVSDPDRANRELEKVKALLTYLEAQVVVAGLVLPTRPQPKPKGGP